MDPTGPMPGASGFICPRCGGALREHPESESSNFQCRIGDAFSALELWLEHCAMRNQAIRTAARQLAENADLARHLARWARGRGDEQTAGRLEQEAAYEDEAFRQLVALLDGLSADDSEGKSQM